MKLNYISLEQSNEINRPEIEMENLRYVWPNGIMVAYSCDHKMHQIYCLDRSDGQYELAAIWQVGVNTLYCLPCFSYSDNEDRIYLHFKKMNETLPDYSGTANRMMGRTSKDQGLKRSQQ